MNGSNRMLRRHAVEIVNELDSRYTRYFVTEVTATTKRRLLRTLMAECNDGDMIALLQDCFGETFTRLSDAILKSYRVHPDRLAGALTLYRIHALSSEPLAILDKMVHSIAKERNRLAEEKRRRPSGEDRQFVCMFCPTRSFHAGDCPDCNSAMFYSPRRHDEEIDNDTEH